mgnify:FL=1
MTSPAGLDASSNRLPPETVRKWVESMVRTCRERERAARSARERWERIQALLPEAERRPFALLRELGALANTESAEHEYVTSLRSWVGNLAEEHLARYTELLRKALPADIPVEGRFSTGYTIGHVLRVQVDERKNQVKLETVGRQRTVSGDISAEVVAALVRDELDRLFRRPFDSETFLEALFQSYRLALTLEGKPGQVGEPVSLRAVHRFLLLEQQNRKVLEVGDPQQFRPYPLDEFAVDLGRLLASGQTVVDGYCLRLHTVRDARIALFIVDFRRGLGQNYGLLSFTSCS